MSNITNAGLKKYFDGYLDDAPIAFVISTTGDRASNYVRANAAYLQLCGRTWSDISGASLTEKGSAIPSPQRLRRLWFLDNIGRYKNETATIAHSSGKFINVIISAQREVIDGRALDFEFLIEQPGANSVRQGVASIKTSSAPQSPNQNSRRASYTPSIAKSLESMGSEYARALTIEMLVSVSRGIMYLSHILPAGSPIVTHVTEYAKRHFGEELDTAAIQRNSRVFSNLSKEVAEEQLLTLATQIWILARFQTADIRALLLSLVQPYTIPPTAVINTVAVGAQSDREII